MSDDNSKELEALKAQIAELGNKLEAAEGKNAGLLDDLKKAQREARAAKDITPEAHQAEVERADKAEAELAKLRTDLKTAQTTAEKATKQLEAEQGAARNYAQEAEIASAIAAGNIVPALVPAFKAMVQQQAKADLVDGKYVVTIGDKPANEYISAFLGTEEGKAFQAAPMNGGGGAPGGKQGGDGGKTWTRAQFDAANDAQRMQFAKEGGKVTEAVA